MGSLEFQKGREIGKKLNRDAFGHCERYFFQKNMYIINLVNAREEQREEKYIRLNSNEKKC